MGVRAVRTAVVLVVGGLLLASVVAGCGSGESAQKVSSAAAAASVTLPTVAQTETSEAVVTTEPSVTARLSVTQNGPKAERR